MPGGIEGMGAHVTDGGRWDVSEDPAVDDFVDRCVTSFAEWDLIIFLMRNPETCASAARLAQLLGRQESDMVHALGQLVAQRAVVEGDDDEGGSAFALTPDAEMRDIMRRFIQLSARREHRLEYVRRVLAHINLP
jgi:hypothetical protein